MDNRPLAWLRYGLAVILILSLAYGAYVFLSPGSSQSVTLFIPTGITTGLLLLVELFLKYDLTTTLSITLIVVSFILFYTGFIEANPERKAGLFGFAGAVFGFATGMPIGHLNVTRRKTQSQVGKNSKLKANEV
jgi:hypothetical protein